MNDTRSRNLRYGAAMDQIAARNADLMRMIDPVLLEELMTTLIEALDRIEGNRAPSALAMDRRVMELIMRIALLEVARALNDRIQQEIDNVDQR